MNKIFFVYLSITILLFSGCSGGGGGDADPNRVGIVDGCSLLDYPDPATSEYILPYQVGMTFLVNQGNCGRFTHQPVCLAGPTAGNPNATCGDKRYAYDFFMPIGMIILAARGGTVVSIEQSFANSTSVAGEENFITIEHADGTVAIYLHFSPNSLTVNLGDIVNQGDMIGLSGDSGFTGINNPHLHFEVAESDSITCTLSDTTFAANGGVVNLTGCKSVPVTFRNAQPPDAPLFQNVSYTALPF